MNEKVGVGVIVIIILALVLTLGYVASRNAEGVFQLFSRENAVSQRNANNQSQGGKKITITAPKSGEKLQQGSVYTFTWTGGGPAVTVSIERQKSFFSKEGTVAWKISNIKNTGSYIFYVASSFSGTYVFHISDGTAEAFSRPFEVLPATAASGWSVYADPMNLFEMQYPSKVSLSEVAQKDTYPQKQYDVPVADFVRASVLKSTERTRKLPVVTVQTYRSNGEGLDAWIASHPNIKKGYTSQARKTFQTLFYKFTGVLPDTIYRQGIATYKDRHDVPQEMYLTTAGQFVIAIFIDFGTTGKYTMQPEDIIKTFRLR